MTISIRELSEKMDEKKRPSKTIVNIATAMLPIAAEGKIKNEYTVDLGPKSTIWEDPTFEDINVTAESLATHTKFIDQLSNASSLVAAKLVEENALGEEEQVKVLIKGSGLKGNGTWNKEKQVMAGAIKKGEKGSYETRKNVCSNSANITSSSSDWTRTKSLISKLFE